MKKFNQLFDNEKVELSVYKRESWSNRKINKQLGIGKKILFEEFEQLEV